MSGYARSAPPAESAGDGKSGTAAIDDRIEPIGQTTFGGIAATGFRTRSTMRASGAGTSCAHSTITSTRIEYFAPYRIASDAANALPATQTADAGGCQPASSVAHTGTTIPNDRLLIYQANTIDKNTPTGADRYTIVIEHGNFLELSSAATSAFDIPADFQQVATTAPSSRALRDSYEYLARVSPSVAHVTGRCESRCTITISSRGTSDA